MFIIPAYSLAFIFCLITVLCWGSWRNTQKLEAKNWRFKPFYWGYVIDIVLLALLAAVTLGSVGKERRSL